MTDNEKIAIADLSFFVSEFLQRAILRVFDKGSGMRTIISYIECVEAALWLKLGMDVGYFRRDDALGVLLTSETVLRSWAVLRDQHIIQPGDNWCDFISEDATFDRERFMGLPNRAFPDGTGLTGVFRTCLLLAIGLAQDDRSHVFLRGIGWARNAEWQLFSEARISHLMEVPEVLHPSLGDLQVGYANSVGYLEATSDCIRAERYNSDTDMVEFRNRVGSIVSKRYCLSDPRTRARYVRFTGQLAAQLRDGSTAWQEACPFLFNRLFYLFEFLGTNPGQQEHHQLWELFVKTANEFHSRGISEVIS